MKTTHPTPDALERYRRRTAAPEELLPIDEHIATCDRCYDAVRVDHLTYEQIEAWVDGRRDAAMRDHLALCELCRNEMKDLAEMREIVTPSAPAPRMRWLAAAAVALVFAAAAFVLFRREPTPAPAPAVTRTIALAKPAILDTLVAHDPTLRGGEADRTFALHLPIATVVLDDRPTFRWAAVPNASTFDVAVADAETGDVVAKGSTSETSWRPDTPLPRGRTYTWQVRSGSLVAPGPSAAEARFHVGEAIALSETGHRERGIALANLGALDDAERELELAGAADLLAQVRSWRQSALPTTTNGAQ